MKIFGVLVTVIVVGWGAVKAVPPAVRELVHLLMAALPVLGAFAGICLLLVLRSLITARRQRRRSPRPSRPPAVPARRATSADPAPVPGSRSPARYAASAPRPASARYRSQPSAEPAHAESSPALGSQGSGTLSVSPAAGPVLPGYRAAALGYSAARPGGGTAVPRGAVPLAGRAPSGPARTAVPPWLRAPHVQLPSQPGFFPAPGCSAWQTARLTSPQHRRRPGCKTWPR